MANGENVLTGDSFFHLNALGDPLPGLNMCGAGRVVCLIDPVGDVYACPFVIHDEFQAGNVRDAGGFTKVWQQQRPVPSLREPQSAGACASCGAFDACQGGCMAAKFFTGLPLDGPDPECVGGDGEVALAELARRAGAAEAPARRGPHQAGTGGPSSPNVHHVIVAAARPRRYFLGTFPSAVMVARSRGIDITKVGSGNPGASNVVRTMGRKWGVAGVRARRAEGHHPRAVGHFVVDDDQLAYALIAASVLGPHVPGHPPFRGGKGVATMAGAMFVMQPLISPSSAWCGSSC